MERKLMKQYLRLNNEQKKKWWKYICKNPKNKNCISKNLNKTQEKKNDNLKLSCLSFSFPFSAKKLSGYFNFPFQLPTRKDFILQMTTFQIRLNVVRGSSAGDLQRLFLMRSKKI